MTLPKAKTWQLSLLVFVVAGVLFSLYFKGLMLQPNLRAPTFGGDGLTIHYNLQYHAAYGEGAYLGAQYYPRQESVFMTDAQSVVAVALAGLRPAFPHLSQYATGVSNLLIFWSNPLAVLFLFLVFRQIGVRWPLAFLGACLIGMMSPQILRQLGGQYTLGFTFLLPLVIWYQLSYVKDKAYWPKSLLAAVVIFVVGLNNPYLYAVAVSLLLGAAGVGILLRLLPATRLPWRQLLHWIAVSLLATAAIFLTLQYFDNVEDRVEVPFGFFHNIATWGGLLTDQSTFPYQIVRSLIPGLKEPYREARLYLGLVPIFGGLVYLTTLLVPRLRRRYAKALSPTLLVLLAGVIPGLVFAFGLPFIHVEDWTYAHLGSILQFRAPVRFGWPFFYLLGIAAVYGLGLAYDRLAGRRAAWLIALPLLVWGVEAHQFLAGALADHIGPSAFTSSSLDQTHSLATENGVDTVRYSSIYLLPSEQGWSDKIHQNGAWRSNHDGYKLSLTTGLPLLNGKLSRVSLGWVLSSLQIVSHPLIEKPLLDQLPQDKDILLLASSEDELSPREAALLAAGEPVFANDKVIWRKLSVQTLKDLHAGAASAARADTLTSTNTLYYPQEANTDRAFVGQGSSRVSKNWTILLNLPADTLSAEGPYELSLWVFADKSRFGGPKFYLRELDAEGKRLAEHKAWANQTYDTQNGWLRVALSFTPQTETDRLELLSEYEFPYQFDELQLRPEAEAFTVSGPAGKVSYNNFLLRE